MPQSLQVSAVPMLNPARSGIRVSGSSLALQQVIPQIQKLVGDIVVSEHPVDAPGMPQYFAQDKGTADCEVGGNSVITYCSMREQ